MPLKAALFAALLLTFTPPSAATGSTLDGGGAEFKFILSTIAKATTTLKVTTTENPCGITTAATDTTTGTPT
eukprot:gene16033-2644_t